MSVIAKVSELIDTLGRAGEPLTLRRLTTDLDMPKSSVHRLLGELVALGVVRRDEAHRYALGPRLLYWGEAAADAFDLRGLAEPPMRSLRDEIGESVHLYIREGDTRVCIAAVEAEHVLRPFIALGRPLPLRAGAAGKVLLAFADTEVRQRVLADVASNPTLYPGRSPDQIADDLAESARTGWATSSGEREAGVAAAAAAVRDARGGVAAALAVSGPETRLDPARLAAIRIPLEAAAAAITRRMSTV